MKYKLVALAAGMAFAGSLTYADVSSENTVGVFCVDLEGGGKFNLISVPMHKIPVDQGVATGNDAAGISDAGAGWTLNQFAEGTGGVETTGNSTFYVEVTDGAHEGRHFRIASNSATKVFIEGGISGDVGAGTLNGAGYKVVPYNRIRDIFGEPGSPVLEGGFNEGFADNIVPFAGGAFGQIIYFSTLFTAWTQGADTNQADAIVERDAGLFVLRRNADTNTCITGEVSDNDQAVVLDTGFNLVGGMNVVVPTMADSGLDEVLDGGINEGFADNLIPWKADNTGYDKIVYTSTLFNAWFQDVANVNGSVFTAAGNSFFINRRGAGVVWIRPSPLN